MRHVTRHKRCSDYCVLYEMFSGRRAFDGSSGASVIAAILEREPAPLTGHVSDTGRPLNRVVRRALAKDPEQRFQTARDLEAALSWVLDQPPPSAAAKPGRRWQWIAAAALLIGAFLSGWGASHLRQTAREEGVLRLSLNPPEGGQFGFGVNVGGIALAPDGRTAAFVASGNGKNGLWVRPLNGATARLIAGTEGATYPFWSENSRSIAFFSSNKLQRVDLAGGSPVTICETPGLARGGEIGGVNFTGFSHGNPEVAQTIGVSH